MVNIPEIWPPYQKYGQNTRIMVNIPEIWPTYQKYGRNTRGVVNIPKIWSQYQNYGQHTRYMVNIPEIWSPYQKYSQHTRNMVKIPEVCSIYQKYGHHSDRARGWSQHTQLLLPPAWRPAILNQRRGKVERWIPHKARPLWGDEQTQAKVPREDQEVEGEIQVVELSEVGQDRSWPKSRLANTHLAYSKLAHIKFGHTIFGNI